MKITHTRSPRTLAVLLPTLLMAAPAVAQEVQTQTAPPPAPVEQSAPAPAAQPAPAPVFAPASPVVQSLPTVAPPAVVPTADEAPAADATDNTARRATSQRASRTATSAPRAAASIATPSPAPVAAAPVESTPSVTAPVTTAPAPVAAKAEAVPIATTQTPVTQSSASIWPWIVGAGVVLLGLVGLLARRRRRDDLYADEPLYEEQPLAEQTPAFTPVVAPIAATPLVDPEPRYLRPAAALATDPVDAPAPVPAEETHIADADRADVDALTAGHAPVADRPWIEFGMRPVRAGTTSDEALVEIELTVGNAGTVGADDVRISTFLFASEPANAAEFEQLLLEHGSEGSADPVSIAAGEGTRLDATLALPKRDLAALFNPVVVADARYRLPDGSEGRTFASFSIGMTQEDGGFGAMENDRPSMHEDVEARLYGTPEHV